MKSNERDLDNVKKSPNKKVYSYENIKILVREIGLRKIGIEGILKEPRSEKEFKQLRVFYKNKYNIPPSYIPLKVSCGIPDHKDWITKAAYLQSGRWCRQCSIDSRRLTYEYLKKSVKRLGLEKSGKEGLLVTTREEFQKLSEKNFPSRISLLVSCGIPGHPIRTTNGDNLQKRVWCKYCTIVYTYKRINKLVKEVGFERTGREGILITSKYEFEDAINRTNKYPTSIPIRVHCGIPTHKERVTTGAALLNKRWCRYCTQLYTYEKIKKLVENIGINKNGLKGILLDPKDKNEFENNKNKLKNIYSKYPSHMPIKIFCGIRGHEPWVTTPTNLKQGSWCPICSEGEYERICRWYFEQIFKCNFPRTNLSDVVKIRKIVKGIELIENFKGTMHFDGYNIIEIKIIVIKLAFEFNGPQHYIFPNQFHNNTPKGYKLFKDQKKRDNHKRLMCKDKINNIILIEFPYYIDEKMNHPHKIQNFIVKEFENKTGIKLPILPQFDHRNCNIRQKNNNQLKLDEFTSILK